MIAQGGRTGYWYVFADTVAGTQTPAANANGPIAVAAAPTGDPIPTGETCNKYALSSTSTGHTMYSGVGAAFSPSAGMMRAAYDLSAYDGIQFDVETTQSSEGAVYFEMLTKESQPGPAYAAANPGTVATGTAVNGSVDAYDNRGYLLAGVGQTPTGVGTALTTSFQTVYVPFSLLVPFYFPDLTACGTTKPCQAPNFVPTNALAFQFNATADFTSTGGYNLWVDNVSLYKGDNGLTPPGMTMPTFNDGKTGWSCTLPTFAGGRTAAGKYLFVGLPQLENELRQAIGIDDDSVHRVEHSVHRDKPRGSERLRRFGRHRLWDADIRLYGRQSAVRCAVGLLERP